MSLSLSRRKFIFPTDLFLTRTSIFYFRRTVTTVDFFFFFFFFSGSRASKTFKPKKNIPEGTHQYELMKHAATTLGSGNLRLAVILPEGEDLNEWVAVNSKQQLLFIVVTVEMFFIFCNAKVKRN